MCGIIGYLGMEDNIRTALEGLSTLEYRGYDSAGIAFNVECGMWDMECSKEGGSGKLVVIKSVGPVSALVNKISSTNIQHSIFNIQQRNGGAIAHTRWATHGGVTELNAHPHLSADGNFAVVHNGIIENYQEIRTFLSEHGISLKSQTDTEVIPNVIQYYFNSGDNLATAVLKTTKFLNGSYAFLVLSSNAPDTIIAAKNGNQPLTIGAGKDFTYITSDISTALTKTNKIYIMENGELAVTTKNSIQFFADGKTITKPFVTQQTNPYLADKTGFSTYMEKEIYEIPDVFRRILSTYGLLGVSMDAKFSGCGEDCERAQASISAAACELSQTRNSQYGCVHIAACGTAYHAGLTLGWLLETHCKIRTKAYIASEFHCPLIRPNDIGIVISQSGETADTLSALKTMKLQGIKTVAICNVETSTIARMADINLPTLAGPEFAVASTKAYCAQVLLSVLLVTAIIPIFKKEDLDKLPELATETINSYINSSFVTRHSSFGKIFFLGKGLSSITALEAALKVKEITYMHCEGYPSGELKHGTLSLVDNETLAVVFDVDPIYSSKIQNAAEEIKARGGTIASFDIPPSPLSFIYSIIPAQLFSLRLAIKKGHDPDKPRNLAKSVTVD